MYYPIYAAFLLLVIATVGFKYRSWLSKNPIWWFFAPLVYGYLWNQTSLIVIEKGFYITEQGTSSEFTGAAVRFAFFSSFVLLGFYLTCGRIQVQSIDKSLNVASNTLGVSRVFLMGCSVVVAALAFNAALSPSGWSGGVDRFNWWENSRYPALKKITGEVCWPVIYGVGICFANSVASRDKVGIYAGLLSATGYMFFLLRMGQKYNGLLPPLFALALPILFIYKVKPQLFSGFTTNVAQVKTARRLILISALAAIGLLAMAVGWFASTWQNSRMAMGPLENLAYRVLVLQGHSYYGADYVHYNDRIRAEEVWRSLVDNEYSCISTVMVLVGDPELVNDYKARGVRYATISPSFSILLGGTVGAALGSFAIGLIAGIGARFFNAGSERASIALQYCGINLVLIGYGLMMMNEFSVLLSIKFLGPAFIGLVVLLVSSRQSLSIRRPDKDPAVAPPRVNGY